MGSILNGLSRSNSSEGGPSSDADSRPFGSGTERSRSQFSGDSTLVQQLPSREQASHRFSSTDQQDSGFSSGVFNRFVAQGVSPLNSEKSSQAKLSQRSINDLPTEVLLEIGNNFLYSDLKNYWRASKYSATIAHRIWNDRVKEEYRGENAGSNYLNDLHAVLSRYHASHPRGKEIFDKVEELFCTKDIFSLISNDWQNRDKVYKLFSTEHQVGALILSAEKFYQKFLDSPEAGTFLMWLARPDPEAATIILNTEKFYEKILAAPDADSHLTQIAESHSEAAKIILDLCCEKKFYEKILASPSADIYLTQIAQSHPEVAKIILGEKKFYEKILASPSADDHLAQVAQSHLEAAKIILGEEKFYEKILASPSADIYLAWLAQSHLEAAKIILNEEKFYKKILASPNVDDHLAQIVKSHPEAAKIIRSAKNSMRIFWIRLKLRFI